MASVPSRPTVDLPTPIPGDAALDAILASRRSVRQFTDEPLTEPEISQLLWAAQGGTAEGYRTAPSAGATYPIELYVATSSGTFHYRSDGHCLDPVSAADARVPLARGAGDRESLSSAPVVFVVTAVFERTAAKYGDRARRYVMIETGHVAQNLLLEAEALGLGSVPVGSFDDDAVARALGLPRDRAPLYLLPVGHPAV